MNKNELTDEEIVKAYTYCVLEDGNCDDCPYEYCGCGIDGNDIIDLIHRQKAEIERLTKKAAFYYKKCKSYGIECFCDAELDGVEVE